jgi:glycosyltransferase involved in cell wall biosynthesis
MTNNIFTYDPTVKDTQSKTRGVGRYIKLLNENLSDKFTFTNNLSSIPNNEGSVFINPFFNITSPPLITKRICQKNIAIIHDLITIKYPDSFPIGIKGKLNVFLNKLSLNNYDLIVTDSEESKKDVIKILKVDEKKIKIIYPTLPKAFSFIPKDTISHKPKATNFCLYVGDATWNKNLVNLAKAIKFANVTCVFIGKVFNANSKLDSPWQKELKEFMNEVKNDKRFIFPGYINDIKLIGFYKDAAVNVLVSRDEGFGFSYLEAASQKCPSLLSDEPIFKEISNGKAIFAKTNEPYDIANKIIEVFANKDLRNDLGLKAFERSKFFTSEKFRSLWLELCN